MKKSFILYIDCAAFLEELSDVQAGRLFRAIIAYVNEESYEVYTADPVVRMAFVVIRNQIERDNQRYAEKCEKNRQIAIAREKRRKELREQTNTNVHEREQTNTNSTDNDNDNDNESTNVDVKETPTIVGGKENAAAVAATLSTVRSIEDRQKAFYDTLRPFVNKYPKEMLRAFYDWWSEPNRSKTKMRVELEKTWDLSRRLATWSRKDEERKFHGTNRTNDSAAQTVSAAAAAVSELLADNE